MEKRDIAISGAALKWVAIVTMLIDHIGAAILEPYAAFYGRTLPGGREEILWGLDRIFRSIGRLAFPIFLFLIVEGFFYTKSRGRYFFRLLVFCLISEVPFDLAFNSVNPLLSGSVFFAPRYQNVFFTLAIGFLVLWLCEVWRGMASSIVSHRAGTVLILLAGMGLAYFLHTDYSAVGVLCMFAAYEVKSHHGSYVVEMLAMVVILTLMRFWEISAIVDVPLVFFYQGSRGRTINKWFFYVFYPAHLLLLWAVRVFVL